MQRTKCWHASQSGKHRCALPKQRFTHVCMPHCLSCEIFYLNHCRRSFFGPGMWCLERAGSCSPPSFPILVFLSQTVTQAEISECSHSSLKTSVGAQWRTKLPREHASAPWMGKLYPLMHQLSFDLVFKQINEQCLIYVSFLFISLCWCFQGSERMNMNS